jgi:heme-degrading monooxygenase HmoA
MPGYAYLWEFQVAPERVAAFERAYGPDGDWVALFRRAPGYLRSELLRDLGEPQRFVSIDHWETRAAWEEFRTRFAAEYAELDARCEALTLHERELGCFEPVR